MKKYKSIDGLKAISILMIVLFHVAVNGNYNINNYVFDVIIKHLSVFIELFFILSAFGMCCGYYEKIKNKEIDINTFYKKRLIRIWPYFVLLIVLDLIASGFTKKNILEAFLDGTLFMGFLPNNHIEIAGIGWTLGVIFAFYILFPFFVFIMWNKIRAWISLAVFVAIRLFATPYLAWGGKALNGNVLTWFYLFIIGGIIFLYKDDLQRWFKNKAFLLIFISIALFVAEIFAYNNGYKILTAVMIVVSFITITVYCLVEKTPLLGNKVLVFVGGLCLQIYLFHVLIFRIIEKAKLVHLIKNDVASLVFAFVITTLLTIGFSYLLTKLFDTIHIKLSKKKTNE